ILTKLRDVADSDFGGFRGIEGGAGSLGASSSAAAKFAPPSRRQSDRVAFQSAVAPATAGSVDLNARAVVSADQATVRISMTPVFQTVPRAGSGSVVNLPLIPGGSAP